MAYLLPEKWALCFEFTDITLIECEKKLLDPFMGSAIQRVQDGVHKLRNTSLHAAKDKCSSGPTVS